MNNLLRRRVFSDLINEKDVDGNTALHVAAIHGRYRILKKLANEKKVDKDAINKAGMTVVDIIRSSSQIAKDKKVFLYYYSNLKIESFRTCFGIHLLCLTPCDSSTTYSKQNILSTT